LTHTVAVVNMQQHIGVLLVHCYQSVNRMTADSVMSPTTIRLQVLQTLTVNMETLQIINKLTSNIHYRSRINNLCSLLMWSVFVKISPLLPNE